MSANHRLEQQRAWRAANRDKVNAYSRRYYAANSSKVKAKQKEWRIANRERRNANNRKWRKAHPDTYRREVARLSTAYVAKKLRLRVAECPPELIELKRAHIQLIRELRTTK